MKNKNNYRRSNQGLLLVIFILIGGLSNASGQSNTCSSAVTLTSSTSCNNYSGSTAGFTQSIPAITCNGNTGDADDDGWYKFTAVCNTHTITVNPSTLDDVVVDLRNGSCNGNNIACADAGGINGTETITYNNFFIGYTYLIRVYGYNSGTNTHQICVTHPTQSVAPNSLEASPDEICVGETSYLTIYGGQLASGANWFWNEGACNGPTLASGTATTRAFTFNAAGTYTIYVRAEGGACGNGFATSCKSATVTVNDIPPDQCSSWGSCNNCSKSRTCTTYSDCDNFSTYTETQACSTPPPPSQWICSGNLRTREVYTCSGDGTWDTFIEGDCCGSLPQNQCGSWSTCNDCSQSRTCTTYSWGSYPNCVVSNSITETQACSTAPSPTNWTKCSDNKQTRTVYSCTGDGTWDSSTERQCCGNLPPTEYGPCNNNSRSVTTYSWGSYPNCVTSSTSNETCTDIKEITSIRDFSLYPNPTTGIFTVEMELTQPEPLQLRILNSIGQVVHDEELANHMGSYQKTINLSRHAKGVYLLQVLGKEGVLGRKIVLY